MLLASWQILLDVAKDISVSDGGILFNELIQSIPIALDSMVKVRDQGNMEISKNGA